jgi:aryl-alcohol dehydrogenase-like predicted oxidoreductase
MRRNDPRFSGGSRAQPGARRRQVDIAAQHAATPAQLALAWLLHQGDDVVPIPGTKRRSRLAENVAAVDLRLSDDDLRRLEEVAPRDGWAGDRSSFAAAVTERATAS